MKMKITRKELEKLKKKYDYEKATQTIITRRYDKDFMNYEQTNYTNASECLSRLARLYDATFLK